jgi:hypothetical protein
MNRKNLRQFAFMMGTVALTVYFAGAAQTATTTTTTPRRKVPPAHAAKSATAAKLASTPIPARSTAGMARPASAPSPAAGIPAARMNSASQPTLPNLGGSPTSAVNGASAVAPANPMAAPGSGARTAPVAGDPRAPVVAQGVGTFQFRDFILTAYGCFRTGTRALCDFDATKQNSVQFNAEKLWYAVVLVDDGGRVTKRHTAYFVGDDGSQFPTAFLSTNPVRLIMEYDDVSPQFTSVSLVNGRDRIQSVPVTALDASQPAAANATRGAAQGARQAR